MRPTMMFFLSCPHFHAIYPDKVAGGRREEMTGLFARSSVFATEVTIGRCEISKSQFGYFNLTNSYKSKIFIQHLHFWNYPSSTLTFCRIAL